MEKVETEAKVQTVCLVVIATAIVTFMVYWLRPVLVPFVIALFVVSGVTPILEFVEKHLRVNRLIASVIAFVVGLFGLGVLAVCLWASVGQIGQQGEAYKERVGELLDSVKEWMPPSVLAFVKAEEALPAGEAELASGDELQAEGKNSFTLEGDVEKSEADLADEAFESASARGDATGSEGTVTRGDDIDGGQVDPLAGEPLGSTAIAPMQSGIRQPMKLDSPSLEHPYNPSYRASFEETAGSLIRVGLMRISGALLEIFSTSVVVLIYVFFILLGSADAPKAYASIQAVDRQVRSYLTMKTVISIFTGVAFGGTLALFGVPMALTFGLLAFLLNYIPNVGPVVASLLPIPFILLGDGSAVWMVSAIAVTMSIQVISGNVVEPKLMGDTSDLHPVVILLALMFWGMMWGITGMFLATPITAGLKIVLEGNDVSKPVSDLLAGRWGSLKSGDGNSSSSNQIG